MAALAVVEQGLYTAAIRADLKIVQAQGGIVEEAMGAGVAGLTLFKAVRALRAIREMYKEREVAELGVMLWATVEAVVVAEVLATPVMLAIPEAQQTVALSIA